jgi:anti-sigma B factor antagonist
MSVVLNRRQSGDVIILDISGRVTLGEGASTLRNAIRSLAREGHTKILLNLGEATYIDSSGLGVLVSGFATVARSGGQLKLLNAISRVKDLLLITKMYTVFDVFDDEVTAVRSFADVGVEAPASGA